MDPSVPNDAIAAARGYEALYVPAVFTHYTPHLIASAQIAAGHRVLDVACGTGVLARAARDVVGDSGHVTGLDAAPGMIAVARDTAPGIDWVLGPVEDADLADGVFDRVVSQFGMMFFRDRDAAARQMLRMLAPGGRVAIAVWDTLEHNPAYFSLAARLEQQVGPAAGEAMRLPFCMGDPALLTGLLDRAGFARINATTISENATFPGARAMVEAELRGWLPMFDIHLDEARIAELLDSAEHDLAGYVTASDTAVFPTSAHLVTAIRP